MTEWRTVPGYSNYQISIDLPEGRCRSLNYNHTGNVKELSNKPHKRDNRIYWNLCKNGKSTCYQAARWIAFTYPELVEGEYFEGTEIDHKDTDRLNNHPSNLIWATHNENLNNPLTRKHISTSHQGVLLNHPDFSKQVYQYSKDGIFIAVYPSTQEAYRQTGISQGSISKCCNGKKYKSAGGYIWKYAN